jgi:hypothetical protein
MTEASSESERVYAVLVDYFEMTGDETLARAAARWLYHHPADRVAIEVLKGLDLRGCAAWGHLQRAAMFVGPEVELHPEPQPAVHTTAHVLPSQQRTSQPSAAQWQNAQAADPDWNIRTTPQPQRAPRYQPPLPPARPQRT